MEKKEIWCRRNAGGHHDGMDSMGTRLVEFL